MSKKGLSMVDRLRPQEILARFSKKYPDCWKQLESLAVSKGQSGLPDWPGWCYVPVAASYAVVSQGQKMTVPEASKMNDIATMHTLVAWRLTQGVYRFDRTLYDHLANTPVKGELPVDLFFNLPEWCIYIELHTRLFAGVFVALEHDMNDGHDELRLLFDCRDDSLYSLPIHIVSGADIHHALERTYEYATQQASTALKKEIQYQGPPGGWDAHSETLSALAEVASLVLYLCSSSPDMESLQRAPGRPVPTRTKKGPRYFPPKQPAVHHAGHRIGSLIMEAKKQMGEPEGDRGSHESPVPHIRRAHWHLFWTGPRKQPENQKPVVRWIPPTPVGFKWEEGTAGPIIRRVRK